MRARLLPGLLLLALLPAPAAATSHFPTEIDVLDATDDSRAYPDVRLPQTDIARFTSRVDGGDVVQTVHVVGPWPQNDYTVEIRNSFGGSESLTLEVERMNSSGSNPQPTDYSSSSIQSLDFARLGKRVNFTFERSETSITFTWPASEMPAGAACLSPSIMTRSRTLVDGRSTQVDDDLDVRPSACISDSVPDGLDGTCPAPRSPLVKAATQEDARDDVGERENLGYKPHDNATLDILSLETRLEDGWVVQTVKLAEPSPRDQIELEIESQYRANESQFQRGAYAHLTLFETSASGTVIGEEKPIGFHVRAQRVEPAGWELRWCASVIPADATCFVASARTSLSSDRYGDRVGPATDPCTPEGSQDGNAGSGEDDGAADGADQEGGQGGDDTEAAGDADAPGVGAVALLAVVALAALAFRRRA